MKLLARLSAAIFAMIVMLFDWTLQLIMPRELLRAGIANATRDLKTILTEMTKLQDEYKGKPMPQDVGEKWDALATEGKAFQDEADRAKRLGGLEKFSREIPDPALPESKDQKENRQDRGRKSARTTPGHLFVTSAAFDQYRANGKAGWSANVEMPGVGRVVRLSGKAAEAFRARLESKEFDAGMLSDLGTDALIMPTTDNELVRFEEPDMLTIRDLVTVAPVTTDSVRFVKHTATTRAAESQATRGAAKPYLDVTFAATVVPVETIAVLSKVTEQDIDDAPRLVAYINGEMRLDVKVEEDRQILWGSGASGQLDGIFTQGITEFDRAVEGDTLIDTIRRMRTDIRLQRMMPNGVLIHPIDWEEVELEKGSDSRYVWAVIQTPLGPRIWGMPVVESEGAENPDTGERRVVVADWLRGATLYDRHDVRLAVGFVDDDFARNLRTLRAEERLALGLKRAHAFTYSETNAAS